ncbi:MAG TPA: hypothetical protein IAB23_04615 [Candidatus Scybalocola faecavium]|nr:hypothetical protein [Candidatus Scybalocola faecavium]
MKVSFLHLREGAVQMEAQAARIEAVSGQMEKIISLLQCQASLAPVAGSLKGRREPLADQIRTLKTMAKALESAADRYGQSETAIEEQYEEGGGQVFATGYVAYTIPRLYMNVIGGS